MEEPETPLREKEARQTLDQVIVEALKALKELRQERAYKTGGQAMRQGKAAHGDFDGVVENYVDPSEIFPPDGTPLDLGPSALPPDLNYIGQLKELFDLDSAIEAYSMSSQIMSVLAESLARGCKNIVRDKAGKDYEHIVAPKQGKQG